MVTQLLTSKMFGSSGPGCNLRPERACLSYLWPGRVSPYPLNFAILPSGHFGLVAYPSPLNSQVSFTI